MFKELFDIMQRIMLLKVNWNTIIVIWLDSFRWRSKLALLVVSGSLQPHLNTCQL